MNLSTEVKGDRAHLLRGSVEIGRIKLDHLRQITEVVVYAVATLSEDELIIRLAASHVAQYVVNRKVSHHGGVLQETLPRIPGLTPERSIELLNFDAIAPQHTEISIRELEKVMNMVGVRIKRHTS